MGRTFLEHMGGSRIFTCVDCDVALTNRDELVSTGFRAASGRAYLFNRVVNVKHSEPYGRDMITGHHFIRDVLCKKCDAKLGWLYEFAKDENEKYKEGKTILERAMILESATIKEREAID